MAIRFKDPTAATRLGQIVSSLQNAEALLQGSFAPAQTRTGVIGSQLQAATSLIQGSFTPTAARTGTIAASLAPATSLIQGTTTAPGPQPNAALEDDWIARTTGRGVVFFHDFRNQREVDNFRWTGAPTGAGNDPTDSGTKDVVWEATGGITGGKMRLIRPVGQDDDSGWWRPLSPLQGGTTTGNGRGAGNNDPGDGGAITPRGWNPANPNQTQEHVLGYYGNSSFHAAHPGAFDGTDYWLQILVRASPAWWTQGVSGGKLFYLTTNFQTLTSQEIVTVSPTQIGSVNGVLYLYRSGSPPLQDDHLAATGIDASQVMPFPAGANVCNFGTNPGPCWSFRANEWETLLYHMTLGLDGTASTVVEIWAAHQDEESYTKVWEQDNVRLPYDTEPNRPKGHNSIVFSPGANEAGAGGITQPLIVDVGQVIFSRQFIACPRPITWAAPAWFVDLADKHWANPVTNWLGASGVKDPLADTTNHRNEGQEALITNWTGGLVDQERRTFAMLGNGGHDGYAGNEVYSVNLGASAPAWVRRRNATAQNPSSGDLEAWADGRPVSDHTAQFNVAGMGRWFKFGLGASNFSGSFHPNAWWEYCLQRTPPATAAEDYKRLTNSVTSPANNNAIGDLTLFDAKRSQFIVIRSGNLPPAIFFLSATTRLGKTTLDVVQTINYAVLTSSNIQGDIDTKRDLLLFRREFGGEHFYEVWNLKNMGTAPIATLTASGTPATLFSSLYYHEPSDAFLTWDGGSSIRKLKPTPNAGQTNYMALAWSTELATGGVVPPASQQGAGMYSKTNIIRNMGNGQSALTIVPQYANPDMFVFKIPITGLGNPVTNYSTSFVAAENPLSEGGMWVQGGATGVAWQNVRASGGIGFGSGTSAGFDDCIAHLDPTKHAIPNNHEVEATVHRVGGYTPPSSHEVELHLRFLITPNNARGYEILWPFGSSTIQVIRWNGPLGDFTDITSGAPDHGGALVDGDVIKAKIVGNTITVYKNGTPFHTQSATTFSTGHPGMGFFVRPGGTLASFCLKDWAARAAS